MTTYIVVYIQHSMRSGGLTYKQFDDVEDATRFIITQGSQEYVLVSVERGCQYNPPVVSVEVAK